MNTKITDDERKWKERYSGLMQDFYSDKAICLREADSSFLRYGKTLSADDAFTQDTQHWEY